MIQCKSTCTISNNACAIIAWARMQSHRQCPTSHETILAALHILLQALPGTALRDGTLSDRVPADSPLILRDGEPAVTLSPLCYQYQYPVEIVRSFKALTVTPPLTT